MSQFDLVLLIVLVFSFVLIGILFYYYDKLSCTWRVANKLYLKNAPKEYEIEEGKEYIGIVVTTTNLSEKKYDFIYSSGILLFIEHLKRKKLPFKLLTDVNEKNFAGMVKDPNCKDLYILGHGVRYGLRLREGKDGILYYKQFQNDRKNGKVIQLHCNHRKLFDKHRKEKSLTKYLHAQPDFKQNKKRYIWQSIKYFLDKLDEP